MKTLLKTLAIALTMVFFLFAGIQVGNSMNATTSSHNGWYCNGDESVGQCASNQNVTCCSNYLPRGSGCFDRVCGTDPGSSD